MNNERDPYHIAGLAQCMSDLASRLERSQGMMAKFQQSLEALEDATTGPPGEEEAEDDNPADYRVRYITVESIPLGAIEPTGQPEPDEAELKNLMAEIEDIDHCGPVVVEADPDASEGIRYRLIPPGHIMAALRRLGRDQVPAVVLSSR